MKYSRATKLSDFGASFLDEVSRTVTTIVSELSPKYSLRSSHSNPNGRSIKPARGKGYAGGIKYYHQGIFYKVINIELDFLEAHLNVAQLAVDNNHLYGGDNLAMKTASHEIKGTSNVHE